MRATYPREGFIELQERYRKRASKRKAERFERGRGFESPRLQRLTLKLLEVGELWLNLPGMVGMWNVECQELL